MSTLLTFNTIYIIWRAISHIVIFVVQLVYLPDQVEGWVIYIFTTRPPAVTDVFDSGRNVGALRPGRRVSFRSLALAIADDISRGHIIFLTPTALKLLQLGPNSKRGKLSGDHCRFIQCI